MSIPAKLLISAGLIAAAGPSMAKEPAKPALPGWMTGVWAQQSADGRWVEEWWTTPRGGMMIGASKTGNAEGVRFFEHMRIEQGADGLAFCALPKGQAGACFKATAVEPQRIVFENAAHDYPTRIAYWRVGRELFAETSGPGGSNPERWRYSKAD